MASHQINFTKKALQAIEAPSKKSGTGGGRYDTYKDTKQKGLILIVSNGGAKAFYFYAKINGKPERVRLGAFPAMPIEKAREAAAQTRLKIDSGSNPQSERQSMRNEITFGDMVDEYVDRHAKRHNKKWQEYDRDVKNFAAHWLNRKMSSITNNDVRKLHESITDNNGPYQANRLYEKVRAIFNKAIEWGWDGKNPAVGVTKNKEKSRDRFLFPDEMQRFLEAVRDESNTAARDYILMSLLTGARRNNVLSMRWVDINFSIAQWRIPDTKNGEPHVVALSSHALELLQQRKEFCGDSEWVFSGTGKTGHLADPKKAWKRILERADIQDLRIHDLRRTLGSWQAAQGATSFIIGKTLGHKSQSATAIYARLNLDPVRDSVQAATDAMFGGDNGK